MRTSLAHLAPRVKSGSLRTDPICGMDRGRAQGERKRLRRSGVRIAATFESPASSGKGYVRNVSRDGMFLRTDVLPAPGEPVSVTFVDLRGHKVEVDGTVRWNTEQLDPAKHAKPGFGMRIEHARSDYLAFYEQLLTGFEETSET